MLLLHQSPFPQIVPSQSIVICPYVPSYIDHTVKLLLHIKYHSIHYMKGTVFLIASYVPLPWLTGKGSTEDKPS